MIGSFINLLNKYLDFTENSKKLQEARAEFFISKLLSDNKNNWLILRCSKCNKKAIPMVKKGKIIPVSTYCRHCGSEKFQLQAKKDIERLDTIYALHSADLNNVKKEMVSVNTSQMDREFVDTYVTNHRSYIEWDQPASRPDNVVPFEKYFNKK